MRRPSSLLPVLAATALLLTACGTEHTGPGNTGADAAEPPPHT
ncbi:hypothetical protein OHT17_45935 [Streptomyces sp. NBC_00371]|nr:MULTISPECIES: hypothetical protein [unclassified Streptomyces]